MTALASRDRRALWVGAALIASVLAWRVLVMPLATAHATNTERAELAAGLLARERALVRDGPRLPAALETARQQLRAISVSLLIADDTAAAIRALATALRTTAREAGLVDVSVEGAPSPHWSGAVMEVQADIRAHGSTAALASWLAHLEGGERLLLVDRLDVFVNAEGRLAISARVRGFARQAAP